MWPTDELLKSHLGNSRGANPFSGERGAQVSPGARHVGEKVKKVAIAFFADTGITYYD